MGCGASTNSGVVKSSDENQKRNPIVDYPKISEPASTNEPFVNNTPYNTSNNYSSLDDPLLSTYPSSNGYFQPNFTNLDTSARNQEMNVNSPQSLPPPQPPSLRKEEILKNTENWKILHDPKNIPPPQSQSLKNFTEETLLPPDLVKQSVAQVHLKKSNKPDDADNNEINSPPMLMPSNESQNPTSTRFEQPALQPSSDATATAQKSAASFSDQPETNFAKKTPKELIIPVVQESFDDEIQHHIKELHEQERKMKMQRELDKDKSQQLLKEKLKRRSELKKKKKQEAAALANGATVNAGETEMGTGDDHVIRDLTLDPLTADLAPQPNVPETKKEVLYSPENIELFGDLEDYAVSMKKLTNDNLTFAELMENLLIAQLSDLEKVRILFHWITAQDLNSINFPMHVDEDTPLGFLLAIKEEKKTYAALFVRLCSAAGLHGKLIMGYLKGVGYYPDYKFVGMNDPFRGSWNGVLVDGQWRLIDTNWGARHVTEEKEAAEKGWKTEYKYEEHYFLTDPDQLINTHFPDEQEWQLLSYPLSLENFEKAPKLWPLFYKLKLQLKSHREGIIEVDSSGYVKFQLVISAFARADARFKLDLKPRFNDTESETIELRREVFHHSDNDVETFEIFLSKPGQYLLKVFGLSTKYSEKNVFTNICFYLLNCASISSKPATTVHPPFPIISSCYGNNVASSQLIARPLSHSGPIVDCDELGQASITIKLVSNDSDIRFSHDLLDNSVNERNQAALLPNCIVHSVYDRHGEREMSLFLQVPDRGNFAIALYSDYDNPSSNTFSPFLFYLVNTSNLKQIPKASLPSIPNNRIGMLQPEFNRLLLAVKSCYPVDTRSFETGIFRTDNNGVCIIVFSHPKPITMIAELSNAGSTDVSGYASVETTGNISAVTIRPPVLADDSNNIFCLKVYAAELERTRGLPSVYVALILANTTDGASDPLPQSSLRIWGPAGLKFVESGLKTVTYFNSVSSLSKATSDPDVDLHGPTRTYNGGGDFEMQLDMNAPLQLKAKLQGTGDDFDSNYENFVFLEKADVTSAVIRVRFVRCGTFSLVVYGSAIDNTSGQLSPLIYTLVRVTSPSASVLPFPVTFGVWGSSARCLFSPLQLQLEKNKETAIKIFLANYKKIDSGWESVPYPDVVALVDGGIPVPVSSSSNGEYEWKYFPGPGEKVFGILVKQEEESQSMTYVLQFKVD